MIQGFRPPRWLACAALVAAALAPAASAYAGPFALTPGAASRTAPALPASPALPTSPASPSDEAHRELAGSFAGVGRERPGRPVGEPANPELVVAARPLPVRPHARPTPPAPPPPPPPPPPAVAPSPRGPHGEDTALGTEPNDRAADLAAHILPLGTGFALMGLGLGYLGVRLRRSI
ncbi:hypothetical protein AB0D29_00560 [Streptomyces sp. NPDC048424]|uniref:hypothetical protein n=1 Tax=Streptomyces sp. NPDC048424 TaxID=3155265 RepID=UPI0034470986